MRTSPVAIALVLAAATAATAQQAPPPPAASRSSPLDVVEPELGLHVGVPAGVSALFAISTRLPDPIAGRDALPVRAFIAAEPSRQARRYSIGLGMWTPAHSGVSARFSHLHMHRSQGGFDYGRSYRGAELQAMWRNVSIRAGAFPVRVGDARRTLLSLDVGLGL